MLTKVGIHAFLCGPRQIVDCGPSPTITRL
jgi:hypothetical protein